MRCCRSVYVGEASRRQVIEWSPRDHGTMLETPPVDPGGCWRDSLVWPWAVGSRSRPLDPVKISMPSRGRGARLVGQRPDAGGRTGAGVGGRMSNGARRWRVGCHSSSCSGRSGRRWANVASPRKRGIESVPPCPAELAPRFVSENSCARVAGLKLRRRRRGSSDESHGRLAPGDPPSNGPKTVSAPGDDTGLRRHHPPGAARRLGRSTTGRPAGVSLSLDLHIARRARRLGGRCRFSVRSPVARSVPEITTPFTLTPVNRCPRSRRRGSLRSGDQLG